jgi:hypothetical protein
MNASRGRGAAARVRQRATTATLILLVLMAALHQSACLAEEERACAAFDEDGTCLASAATLRTSSKEKEKKKKKKKKAGSNAPEPQQKGRSRPEEASDDGDWPMTPRDFVVQGLEVPPGPETDIAFRVWGSDLDTINGVFVRTDDWNGQPLYTNQGHTAVLYFRSIARADAW